MHWRSLAFSAHPVSSSVLAACALFFACSPVIAQTADRLTVPLSDAARPAVIKAEVVHGGITVTAYDGKQVIVEARLRSVEPPSRQEKMLRIPVTTTRLSARERDNTVQIEAGASIDRIVDLTITVPVKTSLKLESATDGDISVTGVDGELEIGASGGAVTLKNVSGSAVAHALKGKLLAQFDRVTPEKPMAFSSLSGDLDLTFPADLKATLSIASDRGVVLSDFDVQQTGGGQKVNVMKDAAAGYRLEADRAVHVTINGGGQQIELRTYSGRIYIRKATAR